mgnify:CR=1 FL=1
MLRTKLATKSSSRLSYRSASRPVSPLWAAGLGAAAIYSVSLSGGMIVAVMNRGEFKNTRWPLMFVQAAGSMLEPWYMLARSKIKRSRSQ